MSVLDEGRWAIGAEYGREKIDLKGSGTFDIDVLPPDPDFAFVETLRIQDFEMNMVFGNLAYGLCDNWDVFVRLGAADAQDQMVGKSQFEIASPLDEYSLGSLDGSYGFAFGAGTRATFCHWGPWSFGGLMQVTWFNPGDSDIIYVEPIDNDPDIVHAGQASLDYWQAQVSLAAIYQVDTWSLWVGPFVQFFDGNLERSGSVFFTGVDSGDTFSACTDISEESQFGGHFGANWELAEQWNLWVEGQVTGDSWLIGVGGVFFPEDTFGR
jgi:hypothetical protein